MNTRMKMEGKEIQISLKIAKIAQIWAYMRKLEMGTVLIRAYLTNKQISQIRQIFSNLSIFGTQVFPDEVDKYMHFPTIAQ